jgi:hypothetical protein
MHRITLRPTINGRIHIPIPRGRELPSPTASVNAVGSVGSVSTGPDDLAYYYSTGDALKYVILKDGAWSKVLSIPINEKLSSDGAVNALRRMLSSN